MNSEESMKIDYKGSDTLLVTGIFLIIWSFVFAVRDQAAMEHIWGTPYICPACISPEGYARGRLLLDLLRDETTRERWTSVLSLCLFGAAVTLIVGIMGVWISRKPKYATLCFIGGIAAGLIYLFAVVAHLYVMMPVLGVRGTYIVGIGFLAVYALFIVGAYRLKRVWRLTKGSGCIK